MLQLLAADAPDWLTRIVITSCEAFENYPPGIPGKVVGAIGRLPGGVNFAMQQMRIKALRTSPLTWGLMTKRPIPDGVFNAWVRPLQTQKAIRRDLTKYLRAVDRKQLVRNAERLVSFDRPALVAWAAEDRVMPIAHGRRLAALLPQGRFVAIEHSRTLIPLDQPVRLAGLIREFVAGALRSPVSPGQPGVPAAATPAGVALASRSVRVGDKRPGAPRR